MPFDGLTTYSLIRELEKRLLGGRIDKVYQTESDEIVLNIRSLGKMEHLLLSANPGHARLQLTEIKAETPLTPPSFCMICRKHFSSGKIIGILQHRFDRIAEIRVEVVNELGDLVEKRIILEIMGKHSNLILVDEKGRIIDCVRHVSPFMSSVRAVQPGMDYELPTHNHKADPRNIGREGTPDFETLMGAYAGDLRSSFYQVFNGFSPFAADEVLAGTAKYRNGETEDGSAANGEAADGEAVNGKELFANLNGKQRQALQDSFAAFLDQVLQAEGPYVLYRDASGTALEYSLFPYESMQGIASETYDSLSALMDVYYSRTDTVDKMRQKSQDLRHLVSTNLDRARKKEVLQQKQLDGTKDREKDRIMGDLITANVWQLTKGMAQAEVTDYYQEDQPTVMIRLDVNLTPSQNAQKYYARYNKAKRTEEALTEQLVQTRDEVEYLQSIMTSIEMADCERDIEDIRQELHEAGYIKKAAARKKNLVRSKPLSFVTSEGVQGYIGKNNIQNDQLTFKTASPEDEWFHVKDRPGSHVILKITDLTFGKDYTEQSFLEAANQAALHSSAKGASAVAVDHAKRIYVKKPAGAKPGFVRYTHQQTIFASGIPREEKTK